MLSAWHGAAATGRVRIVVHKSIGGRRALPQHRDPIDCTTVAGSRCAASHPTEMAVAGRSDQPFDITARSPAPAWTTARPPSRPRTCRAWSSSFLAAKSSEAQLPIHGRPPRINPRSEILRNRLPRKLIGRESPGTVMTAAQRQLRRRAARDLAFQERPWTVECAMTVRAGAAYPPQASKPVPGDGSRHPGSGPCLVSTQEQAFLPSAP